MRIAHVITRMIVGGAQENTLLCCQDLAREHGDQVLLLTGPALGPEGDLLKCSGEVAFSVKYVSHLRRSIHPWRDAVAYRQLRRALRCFAPEVVHTHSAKAGVLGRQAAHALAVPAIVHTVHGAPFHPYQGKGARWMFACCERWAARRCHALISVADAMTDLLVQADVARREKFTTIYSGMDVEPFLHAARWRDEQRQRWGFGQEHVVIGKVARLAPLKGHADLLAVAGQVVQHVPNARFLLIGDGSLRRRMQESVRALGLESYFRWAGLVSPTEMPGIIGAMDLLVHTSLREGLARCLVQALLAGKPVVTYDVDGAREVVADGITGRLVPPRDTTRLAEALVQLAGDERLRQSLGGQGGQEVAARFDHRATTCQIRQLYLRLLEQAGRRIHLSG